MTRANCVETLPPSPKNACEKSPELRAKVRSPSPKRDSSSVTPAHADSTTLWLLYGRPRRISTRSVSRVRLFRVLSPAISQNRCPNSESALNANSDGLRSFSMRSVARPLNGDALLTVGVVEYRANTESLAHG